MLEHFSDAPYMRDALQAWRSTDTKVAELGMIAGELQDSNAVGRSSSTETAWQRGRINAINNFVQPRSNLFSQSIANGAVWIGHVLFVGVLVASCVAALLWLWMARWILAGIRGTEERYRLLFDSAADAIVMVDEGSGRILDANRTASAWTGRDPQELLGDHYADLFLERTPPRDGNSAVGALRGASNRARPVETQSSLAVWGERVVRQAIIRDISERVAMEQERRIAAEALASIVEGVIIADANRVAASVNAAATRITGFTAQILEGMRFDETRRMPDGSPLPQEVWDDIAAGRNWLGEVQSRRRDGSSYPERLSLSAIRDSAGRLLHYVAVFNDISKLKADHQRLEHLATHDALTALVNRAEFERYCADAVITAERERCAAAVLFIDLDAFKIVNDSYSHGIGDQLLVQVAERISRQLSGDDVAGRIGGDEFTVLVPRLPLREDAAALASRLLTTLSEPFTVDDYEIVLSASIGIAGFPLDGSDAPTLIANADAAMYAAKVEERNAWRFY
ncbi:MAG: diguanylate cyclase domain-containing protein, partial [Rhodanobacteraceae bacterium]